MNSVKRHRTAAPTDEKIVIAIGVDKVPTPGLFIRATICTNLDGWEVGCPDRRLEMPSEGLWVGRDKGCSSWSGSRVARWIRENSAVRKSFNH